MTVVTDFFSPRQGGVAIADRIDASGDCWLWTGKVSNAGYGSMRHNNVQTSAHRAVWTILVGPIADGLVLDHLCRVRLCVNPDHLELVTQRENNLRTPNTSWSRNARKTHCYRGHLFDEANTHITPMGGRRCRACGRDWYWRNKA